MMSAEIGDYVQISPHVSVIGGATGMLRMGHFTNLPGAVLAPSAAQARLSDSRQHEPLTFAPRPLDWLIYKDGA
jgi:hypothetical protein